MWKSKQAVGLRQSLNTYFPPIVPPAILVLDHHENVCLSMGISEPGTDCISFSISHYASYNHHLTQLKAVTLSSPLPLSGDLAPVYEANLEVAISDRYLRFLSLKLWAVVEMG